ncbi:MAG TPA: histidine kinase [Xanthomonadales bacterium]|nr:histidine kinase [Xanthomonadales bacterium]
MNPERAWLPDFCRLPRLAAALGIAQLLVLVLALAPQAQATWSRIEFFAASAFALWLALSSAVLLCVLRPHLNRLPFWLGVPLALAVAPGLAGIGAVLLREIEVGLRLDLGTQVDSTAFVLGPMAISALVAAVAIRYFYVRDQWQRQVEAQARAELQALQARIRPHFLFNMMNTIASLVHRDPDAAERAIEDTADLFRAALGRDKGDSSLDEELNLTRRYLAVEALRLGERLRVRWALREPLPNALPMPRLLLQPLVENAVIHGIARLAEGGEILIEGGVEGDRLRITIGNPAPPSRRHDRHPGHENHESHGQQNVNLRLQYHYGPKARMTATNREGYYLCDVSIPLP